MCMTETDNKPWSQTGAGPGRANLTSIAISLSDLGCSRVVLSVVPVDIWLLERWGRGLEHFAMCLTRNLDARGKCT